MAPVKQAQNAGSKKEGGVADSKCEESAQAAAHYATEQLKLLAKEAAAALCRCWDIFMHSALTEFSPLSFWPRAAILMAGKLATFGVINWL